MSADLDLLKWPDEIEDFKRGEWVYLEEPLTEEDLPDFDPAYTVFVTEIPASYLAKHEYPEAEAKLYEIDCSVVEYNKDTYPNQPYDLFGNKEKQDKIKRDKVRKQNQNNLNFWARIKK